jgi:hypothetical protein
VPAACAADLREELPARVWAPSLRSASRQDAELAEPLCHRHHEAKRAPGWRLDQPEPGTMIWATPSGRTYTTYPSTYPE